jgi:hypothetical protein
MYVGISLTMPTYNAWNDMKFKLFYTVQAVFLHILT